MHGGGLRGRLYLASEISSPPLCNGFGLELRSWVPRPVLSLQCLGFEPRAGAGGAGEGQNAQRTTVCTYIYIYIYI